MTITTENKLTSYVFSGVTDPAPTQWPLLAYIPEGVLLVEHLHARWRVGLSYWTDYLPVAAFDPVTRIATLVVPAGTTEVEFKRSTPRYELVRDPLAPTSRVSAPHLQINADQGMMVALEWSAQYGVDGHLNLVSGQPPVTILGLVQHTQNHWGSAADFSRKTWNFRFTGGYLEKEHIKVQALLDGVWTAVPMNYAAWDDGVPNGAPFRMIGPYQLHLDLATLGGAVTGLVIYRRTPREISVSSPMDAAQITSDNMTPSAKHAFFVAVELGEEFSRNVPPCECLLYVTSRPYAIVVDEGIDPLPGVPGGKLVNPPFAHDHMDPTAAVVGGTLLRVQAPYTLWPTEPIDATASVIAGTLIQPLRQYTLWPAEPIDPTASVTAGTLTVTLRSYTNWPTEPIDATASVIAGTLT